MQLEEIVVEFACSNPLEVVAFRLHFAIELQQFHRQFCTIHNTQSKSMVNVSVANTVGQVVYRNVLNLEAGANALQLNLSHLPNGIYFLHSLDLATHYLESEKLLKVGN